MGEHTSHRLVFAQDSRQSIVLTLAAVFFRADSDVNNLCTELSNVRANAC